MVKKIAQENGPITTMDHSSQQPGDGGVKITNQNQSQKEKYVYKENLLHKFLLWLFCCIDGWVFFLWPKLLCLYVRMKQISEDHGQEVAGTLGRGALSVAGAIVFIANQEPVMDAAHAISKWTYEGVRGAVKDFVAMKVAGSRGSGWGSKREDREEEEREKEGEGECEEVKLKAS